MESNTFPDRAWRRVTRTQDSLQFVAGEAALHPTVTIQAEPPKSSTDLTKIARAGRLYAVSVVDGSTVILNRGGGVGASITAEILADKPTANLIPPSSYWVMPHNTTVHGVTAPTFSDADGVTYRVSPKAGNLTVNVEGEMKALVMTIRPAGGTAEVLNGGDSIPIKAINLFR